MVMCWVPDCTHYSERAICRFFRFPKDEATKTKWINLIRRLDTDPSVYTCVCSCHFVNGKKENGPTIVTANLAANKEQFFKYRTPEKRKQRKTEVTEVCGNVVATGTSSSSRRQLFSATSGALVTLVQVTEEASPAATPEIPVEEDSRSSSAQLHQQFEELEIKRRDSAQQEAELYFLKKENEEMKQKLGLQMSFSFEYIQDNEQLINMYTGIPNKYLFDTLCDLFTNIPLKYYKGWTVVRISKRDQLLITLMKLRRNFPNLDLACRFKCSTETIANIIITWIYALHEILFLQFMAVIPSRQKNKMCLPSCFSVFSNCRIVLDCTEVNYVKPTAMDKQKLTYSAYKHHNTVKGLISVAPNGVITFISELYPGSVSDKKIVQDSGVLNKMDKGDLILADKGFLIKDILPAGVNLNIPPFLTTAQFTPAQVVQTRTIARARIHIERTIRRLKLYDILNAVPNKLVTHATIIFQVCGALTNFHFPLIAEVEDQYGND